MSLRPARRGGEGALDGTAAVLWFQVEIVRGRAGRGGGDYRAAVSLGFSRSGGMKSVVLFPQSSGETVPQVPSSAWAHPVCQSVRETFRSRPLLLPKQKPKKKKWKKVGEEQMAALGHHLGCPCGARPGVGGWGRPHSCSSRISTMSVPSSAGGMSVIAESSPSAADSFSIFFF